MAWAIREGVRIGGTFTTAQELALLAIAKRLHLREVGVEWVGNAISDGAGRWLMPVRNGRGRVVAHLPIDRPAPARGYGPDKTTEWRPVGSARYVSRLREVQS